MAGPGHTDTALQQLQSPAQAELLDAIDQLRKNEFHADFSPPQLIVCGDQSSGKSSVLEAISRVRFPSKDVVCTRFATELVLRRAPEPSFEVRIEPAECRNDKEKKELLAYVPSDDLNDLEHIPQVVEAATARIVKLEQRGFNEDKLVITIRRPDLPPLTLVDLPGFIHSTSDGQDPDDIQTVKDLAISYMARENSIILAVVAANNNVATQIVLEQARQVDKDRKRTLGIITKPDLVDAGYHAEAEGMTFAQNRDTFLSLGWHVLKNCSPGRTNDTSDERDAHEALFFSPASTHNWKNLPTADLGAGALREKLSKILFASIRTSLPGIVGKIESKLDDCTRLAANLGSPKESEGEQRQDLIGTAGKLHTLIGAGTQGNYQDIFFRIEQQRLRAGLRQLLDNFAKHLQLQGRRFAVAGPHETATTRHMDFFSPITELDLDRAPATVHLPDLMNILTTHIHEYRGLEPEGIFSSAIIDHVFRFQTSRWTRLAEHHAKALWHFVDDFVKRSLAHVAAPHVASAIAREVIGPKLAASKTKLLSKIDELLVPYTRRHVFILNSEELKQKLNGAGTAIEKLGWPIEASPQITQAAQVLVYVNAQYDIALQTFTENFANLALEGCLVEDIQDLFTANVVAGMDAPTVERLTREPETVFKDRQNNQRRMASLQSILDTCNKHLDQLGEYCCFRAQVRTMADSHG